MPDSFLSAFLLLLLVLDPLGNAVPFLALTRHLEPGRRWRVVLRECILGTGVLVLSAFFGKAFLHYTGVTPGSLGLTGGVLLFLIGLKMIYKENEGYGEETAVPLSEPLLVPLAMPLFAGPSSIALAILNASAGAHQRWAWMAGMLAACAVSTTVLLASGHLVRRIGDRGVVALERLMGLVLTAVAVQMILDGFRNYWTTLPR
jgi:MarC family membrane protein